MKNAKGNVFGAVIGVIFRISGSGLRGGGGSSSSSSSVNVVGTWSGSYSITCPDSTSTSGTMTLVFNSNGAGTYSNDGNPPDATTWTLSGSTVTIVFYNTDCSISTATVAATVSGSTMTGSGSSGDCTNYSINLTKQS